MRLLFAGTPGVAVVALEALLASRHEVVAVLTRPDAEAGRGRRVLASPVAALARERGIETLTPDRPRDPAFLDRLAALAPDCAPVVAYGGLLPRAALDVPPHGWVNLHFSLLPAWRGAAPVQHAIIAGDEITGASTFRLEEGLDTGPVFGVVTETIRPADTSGDLLDRLAIAGAELLVRTLDGIEAGVLVPVPQPADGVSLAPKLTVADAAVDWATPARHVDRLIRGCTPAPGAWTTCRGERLKLGPVRVVPGGHLAGTAAGDDVQPLAPGEVRTSRDGVLVGTVTDPVRLHEVQPAGKRRMAADDWARGLRLDPGERLG
jgi:methionyl-tRNA formyltransferase